MHSVAGSDHPLRVHSIPFRPAGGEETTKQSALAESTGSVNGVRSSTGSDRVNGSQGPRARIPFNSKPLTGADPFHGADPFRDPFHGADPFHERDRRHGAPCKRDERRD